MMMCTVDVVHFTRRSDDDDSDGVCVLVVLLLTTGEAYSECIVFGLLPSSHNNHTWHNDRMKPDIDYILHSVEKLNE